MRSWNRVAGDKQGLNDQTEPQARANGNLRIRLDVPGVLADRRAELGFGLGGRKQAGTLRRSVSLVVEFFVRQSKLKWYSHRMYMMLNQFVAGLLSGVSPALLSPVSLTAHRRAPRFERQNLQLFGKKCRKTRHRFSHSLELTLKKRPEFVTEMSLE